MHFIGAIFLIILMQSAQRFVQLARGLTGGVEIGKCLGKQPGAAHQFRREFPHPKNEFPTRAPPAARPATRLPSRPCPTLQLPFPPRSARLPAPPPAGSSPDNASLPPAPARDTTPPREMIASSRPA